MRVNTSATLSLVVQHIFYFCKDRMGIIPEKRKLQEELMCQGDNILDIIDIQDVSAVSSALASLRSKTKDQVSFICRMGLNRVAKRQIHQKVN